MASAPLLPGVRDLFPDHLFDAAQSRDAQSYPQVPRSLAIPTSASRHGGPPSPYQPYASPTQSHYYQHRRESAIPPYPTHAPLSRSPPTHDTFRSTRHRRTASASTDTTDTPAGTGDGKDEKRHTCPHCDKRFNRPSSLKIHVNTHTGAKPFECPFPGCGRQFNVSSNMRRHYLNHSAAGTGTGGDPPLSPTSASASSPRSPEPQRAELQSRREREAHRYRTYSAYPQPPPPPPVAPAGHLHQHPSPMYTFPPPPPPPSRRGTSERRW